ncbi:MAG: HPr-rel-A system PqqD family peptide chaperone [Azonexus sp.]
MPSVCLLHFRTWADQCVAFEAASATTHLIEQPAGLLLEWASSGPLSLQQLSDKLREVVTVERHDETFPYVVDTVRNFVSLELLEIKEATE